MTKHTAGHWEVNESNRCVFSIIGGVYHSICRVSAPTKYADDGTSEANARLIAAAPELLEALKHAENALADYVPTIEKTGAALNYGHHVIKMARAAIAKATGEQA